MKSCGASIAASSSSWSSCRRAPPSCAHSWQTSAPRSTSCCRKWSTTAASWRRTCWTITASSTSSACCSAGRGGSACGCASPAINEPQVQPGCALVLRAGRAPRAHVIYQTGSAQRCRSWITLTACYFLYR